MKKPLAFFNCYNIIRIVLSSFIVFVLRTKYNNNCYQVTASRVQSFLSDLWFYDNFETTWHVSVCAFSKYSIDMTSSMLMSPQCVLLYLRMISESQRNNGNRLGRPSGKFQSIQAHSTVVVLSYKVSILRQAILYHLLVVFNIFQ